MSNKETSNDLLECIKDDNLSKIHSLVQKDNINFDEQGCDGWTALMLAAKHNDVDIVQCLIRKRANTMIKNDNGQTAVDIARQFNSKAVFNVLKSQKRLTSVKYPTTNYFSHVPLNRRADKRKDTTWLHKMETHPKSKYLLFSNLKPLASKLPGEKKYRLSILNYPQIKSVLGEESTELKNVVFLGTEDSFPEQYSDCIEGSGEENSEENCAWFAVDIAHISQASEKFLDICPGAEYLSPRPGFLQVHVEDATVLAQARPIVEWHQFNKFCPRCGSEVIMEDGGYKQTCTNGECASNKGILNVSYPRMDPVSIMLIISQDGSKCLLGRKQVFPKGMYSCLAGYMEPGESIEDAVRREVLEESGIKVNLVEYHSSQFWPYPTQLMIGCLGYATMEEIVVDEEELEDVKWFTSDNIRHVSSTGLPGSPLWFPPRQAIARQLIEHWLELGQAHL